MILIRDGVVLRGFDLVPEKVDVLFDEDEGVVCELGDLRGVGASRVVDASGFFVLPGFTNSHVHIGDSIALDVGDGLGIDEVVRPPNGLKHRLLADASFDEVVSSVRGSLWEMCCCGVTHFFDYREGGLDGVAILREACEGIPITPIILGRDNIIHDEDATSGEIKHHINKLLDACDGIGVSGFGEIHDSTAKLITQQCQEKNKISSIHTAEHQQTQKNSIKQTGKTEIERAIQHQFKEIIHITHPQNNDLQKIPKNTSTVLCPRSNATLAVGTPPTQQILEQNLNPTLGTDNLMLNSPNIIREMEYTLKTTRAQNKKHIPPQQILKMTTTNPYKNYQDLPIKEKLNQPIEENNKTTPILIKKISQNPYLSIINRTEQKHIKNIL